MVEVQGAVDRAAMFRTGTGFATLLSAPAVLFIAVLGLWPLGAFLLGGFQTEGGDATLVHFRMLLGDGLFVQVAGRTTLIALGVTAITLVLAYPLALTLTKARGNTKAVLVTLVALPYLTSVLVRVYAWAALLSLDGPVNATLVGLGLFDRPRLLGHSITGTCVGMVHILCPVAVLTIWSQMEKIDRSGSLVAASLGASRVRAFLTVFLPQSVPGLVGAGTIVYVLALGAYVIPAALGGTQGLVFAQLVVDQATQLLDWETSGAMGVLMLVVAAVPVVLLLAAGALRRRLGTGTVISPLQHLAARSVLTLLDRVPGRAAGAVPVIAAILVLLFLLLPELVVLVFSFGPERQVVLPPPFVTLAGYRAVLSDSGWIDPARRSFAYAVADAVLATLLGTMAAYGFARGSARWATLGSLVLLAPLVLPEIMTAISFFVFATKMQLAGTDSGIILGQAVGTVGLVVIVVGAVVRGVDVNLEYAAQACGASRLRTLWDVVLPLILPGTLVAFLYAFLHAFDNLVTPLFIAGTHSTITLRMFLSMQEQLTSAPAVIASLLIFVLMTVLGGGLLASVLGQHRVPFIPAGPTAEVSA